MTSIIVGGLLEKDRKYLLVQEKQAKCYGKWNLPAGHLDPGETILEGAKREILEETGFTTELTGIIQIFNRKLENDIFLSVVFTTRITGGSINFNKDELLDVRWFSYDEIKNMKDSLRSPDFILGSIDTHQNNKIAPLQTPIAPISLIKVID